MKKQIRKLIAVLCIVCTVLTLWSPSIINAEEATTEGPVKITFNNKKSNTSDLYVIKHVESTDDRYEVEDATFTFMLKLDEKLANGVEYKVLDKNGEEVFNYDGGVKVPWKTDRSGTFTLKGEQTAVFQNLGEGTSYEVNESEVENFKQIIPEENVGIKGTVEATGSKAEFTNQYIPKTEDKTTNLTIRKTLAYPSGYETVSSPDFGYTVTLEGNALSNEEYTVKNIKTGEVVGKGTTDAKGHFTIKGDQMATFEKVKADVDYKVVEDEQKDGWRVVGEATKEGATIAPATVINYTNAYASFAVTKKLSDNSTSEDEFTFTLTDKDNKVWANAKYYLYKSDGTKVDDTARLTDANGQFKLKANQTAMFVEIASGTIYNVKEVVNAQYTQTLPTTAEGYTNKEVVDSIEILPFVNEKIDETVRALSVTKQVEAKDNILPNQADTFSFVLTGKNDAGEYVAVADAVYKIKVGASEYTYKTDADGKFKLKANETARFENLKKDKTYKVEEVDFTSEYTAKDDKTSEEGKLDKNLNFEFTNLYTPVKVDMNLIKVNDDKEKLEGAEFDLYADEGLVNKINTTTLVSDKDGKMKVEGLQPGTYYLVETKAPKGYNKIEGTTKINITITDRKVVVRVDDKKYDSTNPEDPIYTVNNEKECGVYISIVNTSNVDGPLSGGMGTAIFIALGLVIMMCAGVLLVVTRRRKRA